MNKKLKILVTGSAGFIGSHIVKRLIDLKFNVIGLDDLSNGSLDNMKEFINHINFKFIKGDIRDFDTCLVATEGVDFVLHQAAWGSVPRSLEFPILYNDINVNGTLNILEASRINFVKRVVYASSSSVYGDEKTLPKFEGKEGNLLSPYALTKKINEEYAKQYSKHFKLETIGLRYFNVFGERQNCKSQYAAVIPKFINNILNNEISTIYGDGNQSRDFTYVGNVVEANLLAIFSNKDSTGKVYNIAYGSEYKLIDIYNKILSIVDYNLSPNIQYSDMRPGDIKHSNANIDQAKKMLNYNPKFNLMDGLKLTIEWFRNNVIS